MPVAANLYKLRQAQDGSGEFFRSIQRQKDQYQGIWIISPDGQVLAGHHDFKSAETWAQEVVETIDVALNSFGDVTPRVTKTSEPLPFRGRGVQPDGSVCLAIYARQMLGGGRQCAPAGTADSRLWIWDGKIRPDGPIVIDSLTLSDKDWASLTPPDTKPNTTWQIPDVVAQRFCRVLVPSSDQSAMPRPDDAKFVRWSASVDSVDDGLLRIRLSGEWRALHLIEDDASRPVQGVATAEGFAVYDLKRRAMKALLLVFSGTYGHPNEQSVSANGAVVEWQRD